MPRQIIINSPRLLSIQVNGHKQFSDDLATNAHQPIPQYSYGFTSRLFRIIRVIVHVLTRHAAMFHRFIMIYPLHFIRSANTLYRARDKIREPENAVFLKRYLSICPRSGCPVPNIFSAEYSKT